MIAWFVVSLLAYLLGSIPTGYLLTRLLKGQDIRQAGSGNVGATNVARVAGKIPGLIVLLCDVGKGALAASWLPGWIPGGDVPLLHPLRLAAGAAVILGHDYPCFLRFRGGKGIATAFGVLLVLMPAVAGLCAAVWAAVFIWKRYVSLASIVASAALPVWLVLVGYAAPVVIFGACLGWLAIYRHQANIRRLYLGQEPTFGRS